LKSKAERQFHRKTAVRCFNEAWDFLEKRGRNPQDDVRMLQLAHTSRYHWGLVGNAANKAVGDWQLSRVYAALDEPRLSLLYANSSLEACERGGLNQFIGTAYEALARAYAIGGNRKSARGYLKMARAHLEALDLGAESRKIYLGQTEDTEKLIDG
jgi:hypothetical protein